MGKWTDKLYITHSEWSNKFSDGGMNFGGKREGSARGSEKTIPFKFCSLSQLPFETPCCTPKGVVYDYDYSILYL
ncbi:Peptidyl-prolyl cis-trans isomerase-like 2 [Smittium culicis]|uniref:Peptidyl-prolyl cis-trans isomerase-like 2 n=1 Tax=Smittium culicis TaxID=133412 RepID=A0A1R1Y7P0_9FUNG|nr:Peptidyl-prolyl cis-trans isomerase-like 2 [Smittium culicis]OMJ28175.1 Peptidyl-prolyl cis-trans isomerase-like 2 [Smittium culicis]